MYNENEMQQLLEKVLKRLSIQEAQGAGGAAACSGGDIVTPDITQIDLREEILVPKPHDLDLLKIMKKSTPARIGVFRAGPRPKTRTLLRFRSDHAAAMDAVFSSVSEEFLNKMGLPTVQTKCRNKDEYLTRPDLGRQFDDEALAEVKKIVGPNPQVVLYVSDGLSSTAIESNVADTLPVIVNGLKNSGITVKPFFVKFGRVPAMDPISEATQAEVCCALIGERPGLVTAESMSAYMAYKATINMPEARRNVLSNIHSQGTPAVEAGAHIVDLIKSILKNKASGLDLKQ